MRRVMSGRGGFFYFPALQCMATRQAFVPKTFRQHLFRPMGIPSLRWRRLQHGTPIHPRFYASAMLPEQMPFWLAGPPVFSSINSRMAAHPAAATSALTPLHAHWLHWRAPRLCHPILMSRHLVASKWVLCWMPQVWLGRLGLQQMRRYHLLTLIRPGCACSRNLRSRTVPRTASLRIGKTGRVE